MLAPLLTTLILIGALFAVARHDADISVPKIFLIAFLTSVLGAILGMFIGYFALPIMLVALGWALMHFCYVSLVQAAIVCGIWVATQIILGLLLAG